MVKALLPPRGRFEGRALKIACSRKKTVAECQTIFTKARAKISQKRTLKGLFYQRQQSSSGSPFIPGGSSPALMSLFWPVQGQPLGLQAEGVLPPALGMLFCWYPPQNCKQQAHTSGLMQPTATAAQQLPGEPVGKQCRGASTAFGEKAEEPPVGPLSSLQRRGSSAVLSSDAGSNPLLKISISKVWGGPLPWGCQPSLSQDLCQQAKHGLLGCPADGYGVVWLWEMSAELKVSSHACHCCCPGVGRWGQGRLLPGCLLPATRNMPGLTWIFPDKPEHRKTNF